MVECDVICWRQFDAVQDYWIEGLAINNGRISTRMRADTHLAERKAMRLPVLELLMVVQCGYEED
jgi:hypothetical protein